MSETLLSIFTPTYNRINELQKLYLSLCEQSNKNFVWFVVDDGSNDGTRIQIKEWIKDNKISIKFIYQKNSGKMHAMQLGISNCDTKYFFCVDSDDILLPNAVESIYSVLNSNLEKCIGVVFPRSGLNVDFGWVPKNIKKVDIVDLRVLYKVKESAILIETDLLRKVNIPFYNNETFISEEIIYIQLSYFGQFLIDNTVFYLAKYMEDGLTANIFNLWIHNPRGTFELLNLRYSYYSRYSFKIRLIERMKTIMNYNALCIAAKKKIIQNSPNVWLSVLYYLPSIFWFYIRFRKGK